MTLANAIRGQRIVIPTIGGILDRFKTFQLLRAEDDSVAAWNIVLAPITVAEVGESIEGMPAVVPGYFNARSGGIQVVMTWGGGGVTFRTQFHYPVNGATFAVAGQNVMLEVFATTFAAGFTPTTAPAVQAWCMPRAAPTSPQPLVEWQNAGVAAVALLPWTRAVIVGRDTLAASITVTFACPTGAVVVVVPAGVATQRIEIPSNAETILVVPSAGAASFGLEMAFT